MTTTTFKKGILGLTVLSLLSLTTMSSLTTNAAATSIQTLPGVISKQPTDSTTQYTFSSRWTKDTKYSFDNGLKEGDMPPEFIDKNTGETQQYWKQNDNNLWISTKDIVKGKTSATYSNVGTYNGKEVSIKYTILDYKKTKMAEDNNWDGYAFFPNKQYNELSLRVKGLEDLKYRTEFFESKTGKPINLKGYLTFADIDHNQNLIIHDYKSKITGKMFASPDSKLKGEVINNDLKIMEDVGAISETQDRKNWFQFEYEGTSIDLSFGETINKNGDKTQYEGTTALLVSTYSSLFEQITIPEKSVKDNDESGTQNNLNDKSETYEYSIKHELLDNEKVLENYSMHDALDSRLEVVTDSMKVTNAKKEDVTNKFTPSYDSKSNTLKFEAKNSELKNLKGNTYYFTFKVKLKEGVSLEQIKNKAQVFVNKNEVKTNETTTNVPGDKPIKSVQDSDENGTENTLKDSKEHFVYKIQHDLNVKTDKYVFEDKLDSRLNLEKLTILDSNNKDITNTFNITFEQNTVKAVSKEMKQPAKYTFLLDVVIKDNNNKEDIKNVASVYVNDNKTSTNEVVTHIPGETPSPVKPIQEFEQTGSKDEVKLAVFGLISAGALTTYIIKRKITNKEN